MKVWKPVVGFEGRYEVSDEGDIRSLLTTDSRGQKRVPGLLAKCNEIKRGVVVRQRVTLMGEGNSRHTKKVHDLVATAFMGPRPDGQVVRHLDGNATHNASRNLSYGTQLDNAKDAVMHGTTVRGEKNTKAKITEDIAREIKYQEKWGRGEKIRKAESLSVSLCAISDILKGRTWAWL